MTPVNTGPAARIGKLGALCVLALTATLACSTPSPTPPAASPITSSAPTSVDPRPSESATSASPGMTSETPSEAPSESPRAETAACTTAGLRTGVKNSPGGAGMGSVFLLVTFANTGSDPCTLYGWPGVSLVGKGNGTQLGAAATRVQPDDRRVVTLAPDQQTTALLKVTQAQAYPAGKCGLVRADGYRIYAPGQKKAVFVKRSTPACSKKASKILAVAPVGTKA